MPSISEILDSVSVPALIKDEVIRNGNFEKSSRGVIYYSGGFTVVFPVYSNGHKWAFRCWHTEMGNVRKRFKVIADYVNQLNSSYFCNFYYCDSGLIVDGKVFPTTRMDWINGKTINQYIAKNAENKELVLILADKFLRMTDSLHKYHIAHGDLQHGNIIITDTGDIKLVDYDSLFVPGLEGESDIITGKAEFQHPKRNQLKITSEKLDYFSEIVIYISILAIAEDHNIINEFSIDDSLLFQSADWNNFESSRIYKRLCELENNDITLLLGILCDYLREDNIDNLRAFTDIWRDLKKEPVITDFVCGKVDGIAFHGLETEISWNAENVGKVSLNSVELPAGLTQYKMIFTEDTDILLTITNGLHSVEQKKHIRVVYAPKVDFRINKTKLKKTNNGIETATLSWNVLNSSKVSLQSNGKVISTDINNSGYVINPKSDTLYKLIVTGLDNRTEFTSEIRVIVREPAKIEFKSDKMYTLPNVPITISWNVYGAKNVRLNNIAVGIKGQTISLPQKDEQYVLTYEDDFGESSTDLKVKMLPLPIVKSILVDTPNINNAVGIQYKAPQFKETPALPNIESTFVSLTIPEIPTLKAGRLFVEIPETPKVKLTQQISRFLRNIFK